MWLIPAVVFALSLSVTAAGAELRVVSGAFPTGKAYADCRIDGVKTRCFLDTGSALSLVTTEGRLKNYRSLGTLHFKSAAGKVQRADSIRVGTMDLDGHLFRAVSLGRIPAGKGEATLGIDILGRQAFSVEFRGTPTLHISPRAPRGASTNLIVTRHGLMAVPVAWGENSGVAVWDTGASVTAVDRSFVQKHRNNFLPNRQKLNGIDGTGHPIRVESWRAKRLQIGQRTFRNVEIVVLDLGILRGEAAGAVDAVIGFNVIREANWFFDPPLHHWSLQ